MKTSQLLSVFVVSIIVLSCGVMKPFGNYGGNNCLLHIDSDSSFVLFWHNYPLVGQWVQTDNKHLRLSFERVQDITYYLSAYAIKESEIVVDLGKRKAIIRGVTLNKYPYGENKRNIISRRPYYDYYGPNTFLHIEGEGILLFENNSITRGQFVIISGTEAIIKLDELDMPVIINDNGITLSIADENLIRIR